MRFERRWLHAQQRGGLAFLGRGTIGQQIELYKNRFDKRLSGSSVVERVQVEFTGQRAQSRIFMGPQLLCANQTPNSQPAGRKLMVDAKLEVMGRRGQLPR
jgi:hypothetical protein